MINPLEVLVEERIDLDSLTRNTRRLEFDDGLNDLQNALVFLLLGLLGGFFMSTTGITLYMRGMIFNQEITTIALLTLFLLLILITFGARRWITRYRKQVLWRHLGEMEPFRWQVDRKVNVLASAIWLVVAYLGLFTFTRDPMDLDAAMRVLIAAGGIATGVVYIMMGKTLAITRYLWVGLIGSLLSAPLMFAPIDGSLSWVVFGLIWVGILGISGISALRGSLQRLRERGS